MSTELSTIPSLFGFEAIEDEFIASKLCQGMSMRAISREMRMDYRRLYDKCNSPEFLRAFEVYRLEVLTSSAQIKARIEMLASLALDRIAGILITSADDDQVSKNAFGILDRAGHSVKQQAVITHIVQIDRKQAEAIEVAFREVREPADGAERSNGNATAP